MATYDVDSLDITKGSDTYRIHADRIKSYATSSDFPQTGAEGYLYIAEDESALYRWNGTGYSSISSSTPLFKIPFTIAVSEWVSGSGSYTADIINANITADSIEFIVYNASIKTSLISNIETQKNSSNTGISFIVTAKPVGPVSGTIYCLSPRDGGPVPVEIIQGVLPISRGGTGASTVAGAQANLGIAMEDISSELISVHAGISNISLMKSGHVYFLRALTKNTANFSWTTVATIPEEYRPGHTMYFPIFNAVTGDIHATGFIALNGAILFNCTSIIGEMSIMWMA